MAKTTAEFEIEKHILPLEVQLSDGTRGRVFSRGPRNDKNVFVYTCHICGIESLTGEHFLQSHIQGKKHQSKMELRVHDATQFRALKAKIQKIPMNIAPGEPVPPGFENEVKPFAALQATLDKFKLAPLVGLEYIMELVPDEMDSEAAKTSYHCILCDKRGDQHTIMAHITSYNHRTKYLEKHFPGVIKEIGPIRFNKEASKLHVPQEIVERVCKSIEDYHGRLTPNVHPAKDYEQNKMKYLQEAIFDKHFDERTGPKFIDAVDRKAIENFFKNLDNGNGSKEVSIVEQASNLGKTESVIELSDASSISSGSLGRSRSRSPNRKRRRNDSHTTNSRRRSVSPFNRKRRPSPERRMHNKRSSRSRSPRRGSQNPRVKLDHLGSLSEKTPFDKHKSSEVANVAAGLHGKMSAKCRDEINKSVELLKRLNKEYLKNPERHPEYNDEWKRFWNRRFKEVQKEGKDPSKYDFKPDWIEYWSARMKELFDEDIDRKIKEIQKKHRSKSPSPAVSRSSRSHRTNRSRSRDRRGAKRSRTRSLSSLESVDLGRKPSKGRSRSKSRSYADSHKDPYKDDFYAAPYPGYEMDPYGAPSGYYPPAAYGVPPAAPYYSSVPIKPELKVEEEKEEESNEPITFVSVLRSVSAVEEYLGETLAPMVLNLLSKALSLEKEKPNAADDYMLTSEHCVILETVKEKLKGKLNEKLIRENAQKATKKAIKNIAELIHIFSSKNKEKSEDGGKKRPAEIEALATRIKSALIVQGKTDTPDPVIDEIIKIFIDMAKQHDNTKQFTTKYYLIKNKFIDVAPSQKSSGENSYESLSDSDLKMLLQNFKALSSSEQQHLISYLKKLESTDKERVKKLRTYVQMYEDDGDEELDEPPPVTSKPENPLAKLKMEEPQDPRLAGITLNAPQKKSLDIFLSDDEDDYNDDDLVKSTKTKISTETTNSDENTSQSALKDDSRDSNSLLNKLCNPDTQNIIANLMGSLQQSINTVQQSQQAAQPAPVAKPSITGYNQYVAKSTIQGARTAQNPSTNVQRAPNTQQPTPPQQQTPQQNFSFQGQTQNSLFPINQMYPFMQQMGNYGQFNQQQQQQPQVNAVNNGNPSQQRPTGHTSYVRTGNQQINPWQVNMNQQQNQQNQQNQSNNRTSQPFYQYYQN
ncbi:uncharacterized protein CG7065-like [Culicoides brevitarsis]|uniref:uncharacterized protein CG7065-like n=1 Tax=Culicoides brevitarsis TaxID=469753 RepID=UPI00307C40DD